jgi:hypothetical protein
VKNEKNISFSEDPGNAGIDHHNIPKIGKKGEI